MDVLLHPINLLLPESLPTLVLIVGNIPRKLLRSAEFRNPVRALPTQSKLILRLDLVVQPVREPLPPPPQGTVRVSRAATIRVDAASIITMNRTVSTTVVLRLFTCLCNVVWHSWPSSDYNLARPTSVFTHKGTPCLGIWTLG